MTEDLWRITKYMLKKLIWIFTIKLLSTMHRHEASVQVLINMCIVYIKSILTDWLTHLIIQFTIYLYTAFILTTILADRTNGRSSVTVLRPSSVVCDVMYVANRCVLEQKLLLTAYRKSYIRNRLVPKWMTLTWTITSHSPLNISETVRDKGFVPKDHK